MSGPETSEPPARPSTAWASSPPLADARGRETPRALLVSFWLWLGAAVLATLSGAVALTRFEAMHAALHRLAAEQESAADAATLDRVATTAIAVLVGGGVLLALLQLLLAAAMRRGTRWARGTLVVLAFGTIVYAVLLIDTVPTDLLGGVAPAVRAGLGAYIVFVLTAVVAMFSRGSSGAVRRA